MASEDIFEESEEIISQLDNEYVDNLEQVPIEVDQADSNINEIEGTHIPLQEKSASDDKSKKCDDNRDAKLFQLPLTRIRNLMKLDPDLHIASNEAVFITTRATELFIESLTRESYLYTTQAKKKTMQKRDVDLAISAIDSLMFLDGAMNF